MKMNFPDENREALSELLRKWTVEASLPPRFRDGVWRQIAREEKPGLTLWDRLSRWLEGVLPRPKIALAYVTALLVAGMAMGLWMGRVENDRTSAVLGSGYVRSVDPYQAAALNQ